VLSSIAQHTPHVILVDNTPSLHGAIATPNGVQRIALGNNLGIAAAQNIGIREALKQGADIVWLSDQDTIYPANFLVNMLIALQACNDQGTRLAALAPSYFDTHRGKVQAFVRHTPFTSFFPAQPGLHPVSHAIASGTLIPVGALRTVGLMQENLFIDWVDFEWCWRAKNLYGYLTVCTGDVVVEHMLGDGFAQFFGRKVTSRSPLRHYYLVRNAVHIALHSRSATLPIRIETFTKALVAWTFVYPMITPTQKLQHLRATLAGLWDGLRNRMGQKILD
jgi:rhamnosyltransferase